MRVTFLINCVLCVICFSSCNILPRDKQLFEPLPPESSGVNFINTLEYNEQLNPYTFKNFYNGGGVAIGDLNNDGLPELFFCGNMVSNRLYLNQGECKFTDITEQANLNSQGVWSTGVSMIDINADGYLDIYVCKSGPPGGNKRHNELFINNGDLTFTEKARSYGLDNVGLSVQAAFFDYDKDGDLDCYLLNNSIKSIGSFKIIEDLRLTPDSLGGNKLLRNDNGFFNDVTLTSGIYSSDIGFGLGATVGDINADNWPDIYISNDFFEKDYLYINQQDGTFKDELEDYLKEIAMGSMGADLADINNDGNPEYFATEMLPERRDRQVTKAIFNSWEELQQAKNLGYFNQFGRNVLQLNNGDGTFSEIGRYAGVEATDWSWASLIFDVDNDGMKDIFVSNGIYKDLLDLDYLRFMSDPDNVRNIIQSNENSIKMIVDMMPSEPVSNYIFKNNGDLTFTNKAHEWGMQDATFSNGSAYGDLDNDGDLDLVVNNVNMPSVIYKNMTRQVFPDRNYLALMLIGKNQNIMAIGAKVQLHIGSEIFYHFQNPIRGFESSVDYDMVIGVGKHETVDSLKVIWPGDGITVMYNVAVNQTLELNESDGKHLPVPPPKKAAPIFRQFHNNTLKFRHNENPYVDFNRDRLLFHMNSTEGPCICKADINNDGLEDIYIGGASGQAGTLLIQMEDGSFATSTGVFEKDARSEDLSCEFFDANGDGNSDLYVTSGSSEFSSYSVWLNDRLYFGDGQGGFTRSKQLLPLQGFESTSTVVPLDVDDDGDLDLFVGGRSVPSYYGIPADSYLLENDGKGHFTSLDSKTVSALKNLGMVTDATLADLDSDGRDELIVVGRWMPVKIFKICDGHITDISEKWGMNNTNGWYNTVLAADVNNDGKADIVVGNHGLNTRFHATLEEPIELLVNDFDNNGVYEQIISMYSDGERYPFVQLKELAQQIPVIAQRYSNFNNYKNDPTDALFNEEVWEKTKTFAAYNLASGIFINNGKMLKFEKLPMRAQLSPVYAIKTLDFDKDGNTDLLVGGNFSESKPEVGTYQASFGTLLKGMGDGQFRFIPNAQAGFRIDGNIRDVAQIKIGNKEVLIFTRNDREIYAIEQVEK